MSNSVRPHRWQPTRLPHPWDSPGKNTGVGCHFLCQCMKVKSEREVSQSCPTLRDPMDCSLPGSSSMGFSRQEHWSGVPVPWALTNASSSTAPGVSCYTFTSTPQISESCFQYWPLNLGKIISVDTSSLRYIRFLNGVC